MSPISPSGMTFQMMWSLSTIEYAGSVMTSGSVAASMSSCESAEVTASVPVKVPKFPHRGRTA